jgi:hypothetical protein
MPGYAYRRRSWHRYQRHDAGYERARQHIEEARRLTEELGGTDQDVKQYFFSLSASALQDILREYGNQFGSEARRYAERTIERWRSGTVTMSGMVASRLFKMLPPRMPLADKYRLVENLWNHVGPSSKKTIRVGLDATIEQIVLAVRTHINEVVVCYRIPENLERRFEWLDVVRLRYRQIGPRLLAEYANLPPPQKRAPQHGE